MSISSPPGVFDLYPQAKEEWKNTHLWIYIENIIRQLARDYGYQEIRTPIFERTELFQRGVGATSDIVSKEMYTFQDKGERWMSLRPEGTAPVMRALIEQQLFQETTQHKLYYIAPMFRYERTQAGRYRQHHQFGAEAIGNGSPEQDVELIDMLHTFYQRLGLKNIQLLLNSIGDTECRISYRKKLQEYLHPFYKELSPESQERFETNPLRILDSKNVQDQALLKNAPRMLDLLSQESKEHFHRVQELLKQLKIPFVITPTLVRGLDYYNRTVFEFTAGELGAQNSIGAGGRYDGLIKLLHGPDLPAIGFGAGIERILQTLLKQAGHFPPAPVPLLYVIPLGEEAKNFSFTLVHQLRQQGIAAQMDFSQKKLAKSVQHAHQKGATYVAVIGENELKNGVCELKEMRTGKTSTIKIDQLSEQLLSRNSLP